MKTLLRVVFVLVCGTGLAQDGNVIPFQGQLADQSGQPLTPSSPVTIVFRLYQTPVGGVALWEEAQPNISVQAGRFSVLLGSRNAVPAHTNFNATLYLGLTVDDGDPQTTDVEMRPRQALVPVISASYAKEADKLRGYDWSILFGSGDPAASPLLDSKIRDGSISAAKLQPTSITSNQIAPQQIAAGLIANGTITSNQIGSAAIDVSNLAKQIADALNPPGTIAAFGGATNRIPDGWLLCDGTAVSSGQYAALHFAISTNWGSGILGSTNDFNLPDLRGEFLRGWDAGRGVDGDRTFASWQADGIRDHIHRPGYDRGYNSDDSSHDGFSKAGTGYADANANSGPMWAKDSYPAAAPETRPRNVSINYIIKY